MKKLYILVLFFIFINSTTYAQCFTKISAGEFHNIGIKPNGSILCWGWGNWGQLNNGPDRLDEFLIVTFSNSNDWNYVVAGRFTTFAIKNNGTLWGCGGNLYGGLGINSAASSSSQLIQIGTATNWKQLSANNFFTLGLRTNGTLWGTGENNEYQLGINNTTNQLTFVPIGTDTDWKTMCSAFWSSSFAIKNNGTLWGWGLNVNYLLGDSGVTSIPVPTRFGTDSDWEKLSVYGHGLAIKTNGTLWAWGGGSSGETGRDPINGSTSSTPSIISGTWSTVAAGFRMSFGIKSDGTLWAWGANEVGQLGIGTTTNTHIPTQISTATNWISVGAGYQHAVALRADGSLWSWGNNDYGQLGNGTATSSRTPANVPYAGCTLANEEFTILKNELIISPNPVASELTLHYKGSENINQIAVYDTTGKEVYSTAALGNNAFMTTFTIEMVPSGTYIVSLKNESGVVISKQFVKE